MSALKLENVAISANDRQFCLFTETTKNSVWWRRNTSKSWSCTESDWIMLPKLSGWWMRNWKGKGNFIIGKLCQAINWLSVYLEISRSDIAKRLHNVIESQWQQTLEIISNPRTDGVAGSSKPKKTNPAINNHSSEMELDHIRSLAALDLKWDVK